MASTTTFGFYNALGVTFASSADDIKKAFRKLSLRLHPDRNPSDEAKDMFQNVNMAHACLSDETK